MDAVESTESAAIDSNDSWDNDSLNNSDSEADQTSTDANSTEPAGEEKQKPAPPTKPAKKFRQIDGEMVDEEELERNYKKYKGAEAKFREAAEMRKQLDAFKQALEANPEQILNDPRLPLDRRKLAEKWLLEELEAEMMDPKDRQLREYQNKLKTYEQQEAEAKKSAEQREIETKKEMCRQELSKTFNEALALTSLSKAPEIAAEALRDMALYLRAAKERGEDVSIEELAKHAETKYTKGMRAMATQMDGEELLGFLGDDIVRKINKSFLSKIRANRGQPAENAETFRDDEPRSNNNKKPTQSMDPRTMRDEVRRRLGL